MKTTMTMTMTYEQHRDATAKAYHATRQLLAQLADAVRLHLAEADSRPVNWDAVGDMSHAHQHLVQAIRHIRGQ